MAGTKCTFTCDSVCAIVYGGDDTLDIDIYVPVDEWLKVEKALGVTPKDAQTRLAA